MADKDTAVPWTLEEDLLLLDKYMLDRKQCLRLLRPRTDKACERRHCRLRELIYAGRVDEILDRDRRKLGED